MADYEYLAASNGSGDAALLHIESDRLTGATTIDVDSVVNVPAKFIGTYGTLGADGFITAASKRDFKGHTDSGNLIIDGFAPGNTDAGNVQGQVVVIRPNTHSQNQISGFIKNIAGFGTPESGAFSTLGATTIHATGLITGDAGLNITAGAFQVPANAVLRAALEKAHYNVLLFSGNGGQVIPGNVQTFLTFDASDTTNGYGITADTTAHTLAITRDGLYNVHLRNTCIDVQADGFISWIYFDIPTVGVFASRRPTTVLPVDQNISHDMLGLYLPAGTIISAAAYNFPSNTRLGTKTSGALASQVQRIMTQSLTVFEVR